MKPKFRAYDADDKVMRSWEEVDFSKDIGDDYYMIGYKDSPVSIRFNHKQILMQYTGLKDKNGVEIYEGDIVGEKNADSEVIVVEVVWQKGAFYGRENGFEPEYLVADFLEGEVIGNRFENPELLEEQNK